MPRPGSRAPHACMYHASTRRHAPRGPAAPAFAPRRVLAAPSPVDPRLPTTPTSAHHRTTPLPLRPHASTMFHVKHSYVWRSQPAPARTLARPERRRPPERRALGPQNQSRARPPSRPLARPGADSRPSRACPHAPRACMYHASARRHAPHPGSRPPHTRPAPRPRSLAHPMAPRITSPRNPTCRAPALARRTPPALTRRARPTSARAPHPHTPRLCAAPHTPAAGAARRRAGPRGPPPRPGARAAALDMLDVLDRWTVEKLQYET